MSEPLSNEELLKCPFCGWAGLHQSKIDGDFPHFVKCTNCWAQTDRCPTPESAAVRWNMRVNP